MQANAVSEYMAATLSGATGLIGRVRSVHSRLFNVFLQKDELLTIQAKERICTPMSLVVQWPEVIDFAPPVGEGVYRFENPDRLICGAYEISLAGATVFGNFAKVEPYAGCVAALQIIERHFALNGLQPSVYNYLQQEETACIDNQTGCYGTLLRRKLQVLTEAMQCGDVSEGAAAALQLVGFGPGLTPAGDDFLQGLLLFAPALPGIEFLAVDICTRLKTVADLDTTEISRVLWRHFFDNRVAEPLQRLVESFNNKDWKTFSCQVEQVSRIGHSSGNDYLAGVWWALREFSTKKIA